MSTKPDRSRFEFTTVPPASSMTLRDYFAAKVMQTLAAKLASNDINISARDDIAEKAYAMADAMLAARQQK